MKKLMFKTILSSIAVLCITLINVHAADYRASLAEMPVSAENSDKGVLVDLVKAISLESGKDISLVVEPFARSMNNVKAGKADFHMPLIAIPEINPSALNYSYSTETIFHVNFVLYTKKGSNITKDKLRMAKVETDIAHTQYFDFSVKGSPSLEQSLKKVNAGRIDALIFADSATDPLIKKNNLTHIQRDLYKVYDVKIILPKDGQGGDTDQFLSKYIGKLRVKGDFDKIMAPLDSPYDNWQP